MQRRRLQNSFESEAFLFEWFRTGFNRETCALIPVDSNITAHILRGTDKCDICILAWLLNEMNISAYVTGAVQLKLSQKNLLSIELELPMTGNQRAILHLLNPISEKINLISAQMIIWLSLLDLSLINASAKRCQLLT
mgnify:CR=1 FL=1